MAKAIAPQNTVNAIGINPNTVDSAVKAIGLYGVKQIKIPASNYVSENYQHHCMEDDQVQNE